MCLPPSLRALITLPRADRDMLILMPSFRVASLAPVFFCLSDPARSTRFSLPDRSISLPVSVSVVFISTMMVKMLCDLLLSAFIRVEAVVREASPLSSILLRSSADSHTTCVSPLTYTLLLGSSPRSREGLFRLGLEEFLWSDSRSLISSLYSSRYEQRMRNWMSLEALTKLKMWLKELGMTPISSGTVVEGPCIVKLLPQPVCPYAKMVLLKPSRVPSMTLKQDSS
mmetsp:Transcript_22445/g.48644  ORF Transcript_22445/g.48644 Transcript_22445/m.48644 type:complete len:227 (+) Transcript_22445:291-971(+)